MTKAQKLLRDITRHVELTHTDTIHVFNHQMRTLLYGALAGTISVDLNVNGTRIVTLPPDRAPMKQTDVEEPS